jgi:lysophospholipase-3
MGAPIMLHFLTQSGVVTQEWKDRFIGNFIPIAGAWSGGNEAVQSGISGLRVVDWGPGYMFSLFSHIQDSISDITTPFLRSFQSIYFLLPHPSVWGDTVLVTTPDRSYTASDYQQLFFDIGLTDGFAMYQGIENINRGFPSPNVPTHCFYGMGIDTLHSFHYASPFPEGADDDPQVTMGDGDGSVNLRSSQVCLRWANNNGGRLFKSMVFDSVEHGEMLRNKDVLWEIERIVGASRLIASYSSSLYR